MRTCKAAPLETLWFHVLKARVLDVHVPPDLTQNFKLSTTPSALHDGQSGHTHTYSHTVYTLPSMHVSTCCMTCTSASDRWLAQHIQARLHASKWCKAPLRPRPCSGLAHATRHATGSGRLRLLNRHPGGTQ